MKLYLSVLLLFVAVTTVSAQRSIVYVAKTFLGKEYVAKTLEINDHEQLVINLDSVDCTTFVEYSLALYLDSTNFERALTDVRYRGGEIGGYESRLHYFSDWLIDNEKMGLIKNITKDIGGVPYDVDIDFMSTHSDLYPMLKGDQDRIEKIKKIEDLVNGYDNYIIHKDRITELAAKINSGDILALVTSIKGLDISHVGFALWVDGELRFLHASSAKMEVTITDVSLAEYLKGSRSNVGIMVARAVAL